MKYYNYTLHCLIIIIFASFSTYEVRQSGPITLVSPYKNEMNRLFSIPYKDLTSSQKEEIENITIKNRQWFQDAEQKRDQERSKIGFIKTVERYEVVPIILSILLTLFYVSRKKVVNMNDFIIVVPVLIFLSVFSFLNIIELAFATILLLFPVLVSRP